MDLDTLDTFLHSFQLHLLVHIGLCRMELNILSVFITAFTIIITTKVPHWKKHDFFS